MVRIADAGAGDCVALAPGDYPAIALPQGARALGRSADEVRVRGVFVDGAASRIAGLTVTAPGIEVTAGSAALDAVRVALEPSAGDTGVTVHAGARATLSRSEVLAGKRGVMAIGAARVDLDRVIVRGGAGAGLHASGGDGINTFVGASLDRIGGSQPARHVTLTDANIADCGLFGAWNRAHHLRQRARAADHRRLLQEDAGAPPVSPFVSDAPPLTVTGEQKFPVPS